MIEALLIRQEDVITIPETWTCAMALDLLEEHQLRCAPIVDSTRTMYRGNLYRYHIYQHAYHYPDKALSELPVTHFLKNTTHVVHTTDSILQVIFAMHDLPYVAVLNERNHFVGIIKHNRALNFLSQAFTMEKAGYLLEIHTIGNTGDLSKISKLINKYCDISAAITLEETSYGTSARLLVVLPQYLDQIKLNSLMKDLERRHYPVTWHKLV